MKGTQEKELSFASLEPRTLLALIQGFTKIAVDCKYSKGHRAGNVNKKSVRKMETILNSLHSANYGQETNRYLCFCRITQLRDAARDRL